MFGRAEQLLHDCDRPIQMHAASARRIKQIGPRTDRGPLSDTYKSGGRLALSRQHHWDRWRRDLSHNVDSQFAGREKARRRRAGLAQ